MKKCLCIFITIICCAVIGVLCFFLGKAYGDCHKEKTTEKETKIEETKTETETKTEEKNNENSEISDNEEDYYHHDFLKPSVINGINFTYTTETNKKINITLPIIFGNTKGIRKFNSQVSGRILTRISDDLSWIEVDEGKSSCKASNPYNYKYNAVTKNDIIVMNIYSVVNDCAIPRSGDGSWFESYYFDIKNDKELTVGEAAKALEIKNLDNAKSYEELDGNGSCAIIKINNGNLEVEAPLPDDCI